MPSPSRPAPRSSSPTSASPRAWPGSSTRRSRPSAGSTGSSSTTGSSTAGRVDEVTPEQWDETLRVNLTSPFLLVRAALPHLLAARGAVVAVSSVAALRASDGMAAYSASKAGLLLLTQSLAVDHGRDGLRANAICPGWTATEMGDMEMAELGAERGLSREDAYRLATAVVPQRRAAQPDEIAAAVAWLLSDAASYVNGAVLPVDGGSCVVDPGTVALDPRVSIDLNRPS